MPRVPTYEPRVQSRPVATPFDQSTPDSGFHDLAQGVQRLSYGLQRLEQSQQAQERRLEAEREAARRRAAAIDTNNELAGLARDFDDRLYGAPDAQADATTWLGVEAAFQGPGASPESLQLAALRAGKGTEVDLQTRGLLQLRGKDAAAASVTYLTYLDRRVQERAQRIADPDARAEFVARAQELVNNYRRLAERHVAEEVGEAEKASRTALVNSALRAVAAAYADDANAETQLAVAADALRASAISPEAGEEAVAELRGQAAQARIEQAIAAGDDATAERLFNQSAEVLGPAGAKYREIITRARERRLGAELVGTLVDSTRDPDSGFIDEAKVLAAWRALPEEQKTEAATDALALALRQEEALRKVITGQYFDRAFTAFNKRHSLNDIAPADERWIRQHDPEGWHHLEQMWQAQVDRWRAQQRGEKAGKTLDQANAYGQLLLAMEENPEQFRVMSVPEFSRAWAPRLDFNDYQSALKQLAKLHGEKESGEGADGSRRLNVPSAVAVAFRREFGLPEDTAKWSAAQARLYARTVDAVQEAEDEWRRANPNKAPTREQYEQWISEQFVRGEVPGTGVFFDDRVTRAEFDLNPKYRGKAFVEKGVPTVEQLPEEAAKALTAVLEEQGIPVDDVGRAHLLSKIARELRLTGREVTPDAIAARLLQVQQRLAEQRRAREEERATEERVKRDTEALLDLFRSGGELAPTDKRLIGFK